MNVAQIVRPAIRSLLANWRSMVLIQASAALLVIAYYAWPPLRGATEGIAKFKSEAGLWFPIVMVWFASLIVPEVARFVTRSHQDKRTRRDFIALVLYFGLIGLILEFWYGLLAKLLGDSNAVGTVVIKFMLDQFVMSPLLSMPIATIFFLFKDKGYAWGGVSTAIKDGEFFKRYVSTLATCWIFWPPIVIVMYALPYNLQYFLSMLAQAAWSILIIHMSSRIIPAEQATP